jgi:transposase-like protein
MDRRWLARRLDEGASYEQLARELGCSASKVSYWASKHGLRSAHTGRHAARGGVDQARLRALVAAGSSIREIADDLDVSATTVRHWLDRHTLSTRSALRRLEGALALAAGADEAFLTCPIHGPARHVRRGGGFRCILCRSAHVTARRRRVKQILLAEAGGSCVICGYDRCVAALHFHHVDPDGKDFAVAAGGATVSLDVARSEARKCVVLCANCHAEVESGLADIPGCPPPA